MFTNQAQLVLGDAPISLKVIRLRYPQAGYYRTITYVKSNKTEITGPYNTQENAQNHPVFLGRSYFVYGTVEFLYTAPEGATLPNTQRGFVE